MVASPVSLAWLEEPPAPTQTSLDLGTADGRVPRVPVAKATDVDGALQELFGFPGFRPGQREAVEAARAGRDVLVVMPTGSGKSLCYQLPALMRTDLTLVVSPLVSLMQDQVEALERIAPGRVALVNGQQDSRTNRLAIDHAVSGQVRLLYVAPERFASPGFLERIRHADIGLFVVDEAHCVSQWGHDFRPEYFRLADAARWLGAEAILASTATATPEVARDIVERLGLREAVHVATGFDRPNLTFAVVDCANKDVVHRRIAAALSEPDALPAIVYAGTRAESDRLADRLGRELGVEVIAYHAGLPRDVARRGPAALHGRRGPGRGGHERVRHGRRQGRRADGLPRVGPELDRGLLPGGRPRRARRQARALPAVRHRPRQGPARLLHRALGGRRGPAEGRRAPDQGGRRRASRRATTCTSTSSSSDGDEDAIRAVVGYLARAGVILPAPSAPDRLAGRYLGTWDAKTLAVCKAAAHEGTRVRWRQYRSVWAWVEGGGCRRTGILRHFGDRSEPSPIGAVLRRLRSGARRGRARHAAAPERARPRRWTCRARSSTSSRARCPGVGRTRAVEILRGGRSKAIAKHSYDGLPNYGAYRDLRAEEVLAAIDALVAAGTLRATDERFPKLEVVATRSAGSAAVRGQAA